MTPTDDDTGKESPLAKHVAQLVAKELRSTLETLDQRVIAGVLSGLVAWRREVDDDRESTRIRLATLEADVDRLQMQVDGHQREIQNIKTIVFGAGFRQEERNGTDPLPDTERPPPNEPEAA